MYCPSCGTEISVELKYCNRCGANLTLGQTNLPAPVYVPVKLTAPMVVLGLTITGAMGIVFGAATEFARIGLHPAAITWMILFSMATLFGCTALLIRFLTKLYSLQREIPPPQRQDPRLFSDRQATPQLPPRFEQPSVTENTTRTFSPVYRERQEG
jgi:hypothetical protein